MSAGIQTEHNQEFRGITLSDVFYFVAHRDDQKRPTVIKAQDYDGAPYKGNREQVIADAVTVFDAEFGTTDKENDPGEDRFLTQGSIWLSYGRNSKPKVRPEEIAVFDPESLG
jgi:hypothetical protein